MKITRLEEATVNELIDELESRFDTLIMVGIGIPGNQEMMTIREAGNLYERMGAVSFLQIALKRRIEDLLDEDSE